MQEQWFFCFQAGGQLFSGGFEKILGGGRNFAGGLPPPESGIPTISWGRTLTSPVCKGANTQKSCFNYLRVTKVGGESQDPECVQNGPCVNKRNDLPKEMGASFAPVMVHPSAWRVEGSGFVRNDKVFPQQLVAHPKAQNLRNWGPLHTRAKSRDHGIMRAQKKLVKRSPSTPPKSWSVATDPQV